MARAAQSAVAAMHSVWAGPSRERQRRTATGEMVGPLVMKERVVPRGAPDRKAPTPIGITPQEQIGRRAPTPTARSSGFRPPPLKYLTNTPTGTHCLMTAAII